MRALEKDPARRFADADEFIAALEAARSGAAPEPTTAFVPPPVVPVPAAAPVEEVHERRALVEEPPEDERRRGVAWWIWALALLLVVGAVIAGAALLGGGDEVQVPNVVGSDLPAAELALRRAGFEIETNTRNDDEPRNTVIGQDPSGGSRAEEGSTVTLTISEGPAVSRVPGLNGLTFQSAQARLERAGFEVERRDQASDSVERGRVISSTPAEGAEAERGSTVTLVVSTGAEQVTVPDVVGSTEDEARSRLGDEGLRVTVRREASQDEEPGTVLRQDPAAGREVDDGSTVTIVVAREPQEVPVPDITGETQADAVARLSDDGFRIRQRTQPVDSEDGDGVVISQDPAGGNAPRGSTVTITVGEFTAPETSPQETTPPDGSTQPTP